MTLGSLTVVNWAPAKSNYAEIEYGFQLVKSRYTDAYLDRRCE